MKVGSKTIYLPYLEGQFVGCKDLKFAYNNKCERFLHKVGRIIFFNIHGWAFIRGSVFGEIC